MTQNQHKLMKILNNYKNMKHFSFKKDVDDKEFIFPLPLHCLIIGKSDPGETMLL